MDFRRLSSLLKKYSPAHCRDICAALKSLINEIEYTKAALSKDLIAAQNLDNYTKAREILDIQEELSKEIAKIQEFLESVDQEHDKEETVKYTGGGRNSEENNKHIDYNQYSMDDTIAYDIANTNVTFKKPAGLSFKGKWHAVTTWKSLYAKVCEILYKMDQDLFRSMLDEERKPGRRRIKMSTNKADLHSPVKVEGSNIWLETNRSAADIRRFILTLLERYNVSPNDVKVFFRRDYSELHEGDEGEQ